MTPDTTTEAAVPKAGERPSSELVRYRITYSGDGAGVAEVQGWEAVVADMAPHFGGDEAEVRDMLANGFDGYPGWNGRSVNLIFEDGGVLVEKIADAPSPSPAPVAAVDLDELSRLEKAATPGEWECREHEGLAAIAWRSGFVLESDAAEQDVADCRFVVAARNAMPSLLSELARLREVERLLKAEPAALESATDFLIRDLGKRRCDNEAIASCIKCNGFYVASRMKEVVAALAKEKP